MESKGKVMPNYSRGVKWHQGATVRIAFCVHNVLDFDHFIRIKIVQWCSGWQGKVVMQ